MPGLLPFEIERPEGGIPFDLTSTDDEHVITSSRSSHRIAEDVNWLGSGWDTHDRTRSYSALQSSIHRTTMFHYLYL